MVSKRRKNQSRQDDETLEQWLRRRAAEGSGIPIDPRMTLELYDRVAALEGRLAELEARDRHEPPGGS